MGNASKVPTDPNMSGEVRSFLDTAQKSLDDAIAAVAAAPTTKTQTEYLSGGIKFPIAQDYRIIEKIPYGATVTALTGKTSSGTLTATFKINSTAITTGVISATSTQSSVAPTALNVMVAWDALVITVSAVAAPVDFSFTVVYTRALV